MPSKTNVGLSSTLACAGAVDGRSEYNEYFGNSLVICRFSATYAMVCV
jgi:hypothetical protein